VSGQVFDPLSKITAEEIAAIIRDQGFEVTVRQVSGEWTLGPTWVVMIQGGRRRLGRQETKD
jgi:hypothetical protein